jgi:6-pyruvoyltetrahydropterin/6-carboxytetrahydropterin synthase
MFEIEKIFTFEAGHQLLHHDGKCCHPHGHSYVLTVKLRSDKLIEQGAKQGMVTDYGDISNIVKPMIVKYLDHHWLNETLESDSTTAEYIAKWIFDYLSPLLPKLYSISINETATSRATYTAHFK